MPALGYKSMTGFEGSNKIPQCANYVYSETFKYAWKFVREHYLLREANSFSRPNR